MDKKNIWFITPKTNLHVGNENTSSYGLIDLAIQRNATTNLPCINSSSLKGAINEFAANSNKDLDLLNIFGSDKTDKSKGSQKGLYTFFDANILFIPVQDKENLYHLATNDEVSNRFIDFMKLLGVVDSNYTLDNLKNDIHNCGVIDEKRFNDIEWNANMKDLCSDDNLPIIARNVLENGEGKNLWYEQVLPAETILYTAIDNKSDNNNSLFNELSKSLVQIGAGATIGYGYCKFTNLKK